MILKEGVLQHKPLRMRDGLEICLFMDKIVGPQILDSVWKMVKINNG